MGRIVDAAELLALVSADRQAGRRIALASGCFDILHVGHVRGLAAAASEADRLVVAVSDDESVRLLRGESRPILPAADRAELVAALRVVDYVTIFAGGTVADLLDAVRPDVYCQGTDDTAETEGNVVRAYGGRLAIVGDRTTHATRDLLARIESLDRQP